MGINQDAYDVWNNLGKYLWSSGNNPTYNAISATKQWFLHAIKKANAQIDMPVPTKKDLNNGFLREYQELNPTTQVAIKEYIFAMSDKEYRMIVEQYMEKQVIRN